MKHNLNVQLTEYVDSVMSLAETYECLALGATALKMFADGKISINDLGGDLEKEQLRLEPLPNQLLERAATLVGVLEKNYLWKLLAEHTPVTASVAGELGDYCGAVLLHLVNHCLFWIVVHTSPSPDVVGNLLKNRPILVDVPDNAAPKVHLEHPFDVNCVRRNVMHIASGIAFAAPKAINLHNVYAQLRKEALRLSHFERDHSMGGGGEPILDFDPRGRNITIRIGTDKISINGLTSQQFTFVEEVYKSRPNPPALVKLGVHHPGKRFNELTSELACHIQPLENGQFAWRPDSQTVD